MTRQIPSSRTVPLLSSVRNQESSLPFLNFIDFSEKLFSFGDCDNVIDASKLIYDFVGNADNQYDHEYRLFYCFNLLFHFSVVRQKHRLFFVTLLSQIILQTKDATKVFNISLKTNVYLQKRDNYVYSTFFYLLSLQGLITTKQLHEPDLTLPQTDERKDLLFSLYPKNSLPGIIKDDNLEALKAMDQNKLSELCQNFYLLELYFVHYSLYQFAAFYGSTNCFKFLHINNFKQGSSRNLASIAVAGGNIEIARLLDQINVSFDYCFKTSIKYHNRMISDWLLENFKCEIIQPEFDIHWDYTELLFLAYNGLIQNINIEFHKMLQKQYYDHNLFLFYLKNNVDTSDLFYRVCNHNHINKKTFLYLFDNNFDPNAGFNSKISNFFTPLDALLSHNPCDKEALKMLLSKNADPNVAEYTPLPECRTVKSLLLLISESNRPDIEVMKILLEHNAKMDNNAFLNLFLNPRATLEMIKLFIKYGADVNYKNGSKSPLFNACEKGNVEIIKYLLENGANPNDKPYPLIKACSFHPSYDVVKLLLDYGANPNVTDNKIIPLCSLIQKGSFDIIELMTERGADIAKYKQQIFESLLKSRSINTDLLKKLLLEHNVKPNKTSYIVTVCNNNPKNTEAIRLLLENGAPLPKSSTSSDKNSPLDILCQSSTINFEAFKLLAEHGAQFQDLCQICKKDINKNNLDVLKYALDHFKFTELELSNSLLSICQKSSNDDAIKLFFAHGTKTINQSFYYYLISQQPSIEIVDLFLKHGADINACPTGKDPALFFLCHNPKNEELVKFLLDKGIDIHIKHKGIYDNFKIETPILFHCEKLSFDLIKLFIEKGADVNETMITTDLYHKEISLETNILYDSTDFNYMKFWIENGADPNKGDKSPLISPLVKNSKDCSNILKYLLEHGVDISKISLFENSKKEIVSITCLGYYIECNLIEAVKLLLQYHANPNEKYGFIVNGVPHLCKSPISFATMKRNYEMVKLLLENGADPNQGKIKGNKYEDLLCPLCIAIQNKDETLIKLLLENGAKVNEDIISLLEVQNNQNILLLLTSYLPHE